VDVFIGTLMVVMGVSIAGIWTRDIVAGEQVDLSVGFFSARDPEAGTLFWPHWLAEYTTAAALLVGGIGLATDVWWSGPLAACALGALFSTSTNSLGWALARRERFAYAISMSFGLVVSLIGVIYLIVR
jgi:hypothetical protein